MDELRYWHRLFGLLWTDFLHDQPVTVDVEKDLSLKQQFLDVVLIRREEGGEISVRLPDGFENLGPHNLISFKSYRETLNCWAVKELVGHYVNYRKQASPSMDDLLPKDHFRCYAVTAQFPRAMASRVGLRELAQGVYEVTVLDDDIRIVVVSRLPQNEQNAMLHLFAEREELRRFGMTGYAPRSAETSTVLYQLFDAVRVEGINMPFDIEQFKSDVETRWFDSLPLERRARILFRDGDQSIYESLRIRNIDFAEFAAKMLEGVPTHEAVEALDKLGLLGRIPAEKRLEGVQADEILKNLSPEVLEQIRQRLSDKPSP